MKVIDPLSEVTRRERRSLLGVSALSIAMSITHLIPTKISALGVEFPPTEQGLFLLVVAGVVIFYLLAFIVYAWADYINWKTELHMWRVQNQPPLPDDEHEEEYEFRSGQDRLHQLYSEGDIPGAERFENELIYSRVKKELESQYQFQKKKIPAASKLRAIFEFIVPIVIAVVAIGILLTTEIKKADNSNKIYEKCLTKKSSGQFKASCLLQKDAKALPLQTAR